MALKALIFDVDGTIAETEELHRRAFNQCFVDNGYDWHWDEELYRELLKVTGGKERIRHFLETLSPVFSKSISDAEIAELHIHKTGLYGRFMQENPPPLRPGIRRLMQEAVDAGVMLALGTTTSRNNADQLLNCLFDDTITRQIKVRICGEDVGAKKPDPEVFILAAKALCVKQDEALVFEDSSAGLQAATHAGIATIVTPGIYTGDHDFINALAVISHLGEPHAPYQHIDGQGADGKYVSIESLNEWSAAIGLAQ